jgi:hypothetical protein
MVVKVSGGQSLFLYEIQKGARQRQPTVLGYEARAKRRKTPARLQSSSATISTVLQSAVAVRAQRISPDLGSKMLGTRKLFFMVVGSLLCLVAANPVQAASQRTRKRVVKQVSKTATPAVPSGPLAQLTLEEIPASAPQITYRDNQLTIVAQNSTLSDILRAVHQQTGAIIETPGNPTERVVVHLGPGPARDVLAALLNGSHFDYVMLGTTENPTSIAHVILTAKSSTEPVQQANAGQPAPQPQEAEQDASNEVGSNDDFATADEEPEPESDTPDQVQADDQQQQPQAPNGQVMRSPEQLLQELQQRQLQQQQLQQQQGNGTQPTPAAPQPLPMPPDQQAPPQ